MWNGMPAATILSFDLDCESLWLSIGMTSPTYMSRGRYGARVGAPRLLDLLERHDAQATWFVPGETVRRYPELVKEIHARGHEIGHHNDVHEIPLNLEPQQEREVMGRAYELIERTVGEPPRGFRAPGFDHSEHTLDVLQEVGMDYDSSLMAHDFEPYELTDADGVGTGVLELPVSWELDDAPHFLFTLAPMYVAGLASPAKVEEIWRSEFDGALAHEGLFSLTAHPQIIGRWHRLQMLERLLAYMSDQTWFATASQVVEEYRQRTTA
jgi:peptidoglycan-N-acetylglucosamine deacetylase